MYSTEFMKFITEHAEETKDFVIDMVYDSIELSSFGWGELKKHLDEFFE